MKHVGRILALMCLFNCVAMNENSNFIATGFYLKPCFVMVRFRPFFVDDTNFLTIAKVHVHVGECQDFVSST